MPSMRANDEHIAQVRHEVNAATRALSAEFGAPLQNNQATAV
jgi:hypothetical protein